MTKLSGKLTNGVRLDRISFMSKQQSHFGNLFKKFRLRSGFVSLRDFGDALSEKGFPFEDSLFSHWQKNTRIPKDRKLLLTTIEIFLENGGITSVRDVNNFLVSTGQGNLTEEETTLLIQKNPHKITPITSPQKAFEFLISTAHSKRLIRSGWIREKVKDPESVAEHSFQLSIMAMIFADHFGLDREKLLKMAIMHDLGEVITGDIVWARWTYVNLERKVNKESAELAGITDMFKLLGKDEEYKKIFEEMLEGKSAEAKIFWELDKLEMALQALIYEKENNKNLEEFFVTSNINIKTPYLREMFNQILTARPKLKKQVLSRVVDWKKT